MNQIQIIIDENGNIVYNRDNDQILEIIKEIASEEDLKEAIDFIESKPISLDPNQKNFCG